MPNYSLLFAGSAQDADNSALVDWRWDKLSDLGRHEYRRPDTGERIRFAPDGPHSLQNLRWGTRVYLGNNARRRTDAHRIKAMVVQGFFVLCDPELPPPRVRKLKNRPRPDGADAADH